MTRRIADWTEWSEQQLAALLHLSFAMPVHEGYLRRRLKVHNNTILSLIRTGLARRIYFAEQSNRGGSGTPFITLTQMGNRVRGDYILWNSRLRDKIGSLPAMMAAIADTPR